MVHKDTVVMPHDAITTSSQRITDRVKTSCGQSLHTALASLGTAVAACPPDHEAEGICQAEGLATWEGEGGTSVFAE